MDPARLARNTGTTERYIREWLSAQAASGYIEYDSASGKFSMLPDRLWHSPTRIAQSSWELSEAWSRPPF